MPGEYDPHRMVAEAFKAAGLPCARIPVCPAQAHRLFLGGVGVEIKKGRPNARELLRQVSAILACDGSSRRIVVARKKVHAAARAFWASVTNVSPRPLCKCCRELSFYLRDAPVDGIYGTCSYNRKSRVVDDQGRALRHRACQAPLPAATGAAGAWRFTAHRRVVATSTG